MEPPTSEQQSRMQAAWKLIDTAMEKYPGEALAFNGIGLHRGVNGRRVTWAVRRPERSVAVETATMQADVLEVPHATAQVVFKDDTAAAIADAIVEGITEIVDAVKAAAGEGCEVFVYRFGGLLSRWETHQARVDVGVIAVSA